MFQEYILPEVKDRQYLITLHKRAKKVGLDLDRYNQVKEQIYTIESDLRRLRDPLQVSTFFLADFLKSWAPILRLFVSCKLKMSCWYNNGCSGDEKARYLIIKGSSGPFFNE